MDRKVEIADILERLSRPTPRKIRQLLASRIHDIEADIRDQSGGNKNGDGAT